MSRRPTILDQVPRDRHVVIEASAGTGKTFTLENLVLDLLRDGTATLDRILVVTFTDKATAELKQRLRRALHSLLEGHGDAHEGWCIDDRGRARLERALHSFDDASISTIHSFCQRILVENAFIHRRLFEQERVRFEDESASALRETLRGEIALATDVRVYLEAGLRALAFERIEATLRECLRQRLPLRPRFRPDELQAAVASYPLGAASDERCARQLKASGVGAPQLTAVRRRLASLEPILEEARRTGDLARLLEQIATGPERAHSGGCLGYARARLADVGQLEPPARNVVGLLRALVPLEAAVVQRLLPSVQCRLDERKRERGTYDYDDMLRLVHDSLQGAPGAWLIERLRARYGYVLIDEFQDTDDVQWAIFRRLFFPPESGAHFCLIGDPKQAIYGFRGADVRTYLRACSEIERSSGGMVSLTRNFRSTEALIEACNRVFHPEEGDPAFFSGGVASLHPIACGHLSLGADGTLAQPPVQVLGLEGDDDVPSAGARMLRRRLAERIAGEIRRLLFEEPVPLWLRQGDELRRLRARDIHVLTYTSAEGRDLGAALRAAGIPYAYYKQDGLFQTVEAEHVCDLLAAVDDPGDISRCCHAWLTPFFDCSLEDLAACRELASHHPWRARLLEWHRLSDEGRLGEMLERVIADSGLLERRLFFDKDERALTNYLQILELLTQEVAGSPTTLRQLVARLRSYRDGVRQPPGQDGDVQRLESEVDAVQIMTMHKAKGLEAAVVFVAGGLGRPPGGQSVHVYHEGEQRVAWVGQPFDEVVETMRQEADEAWQRLMYVALTRARVKLYLPYVPPREKNDWIGHSPYACINSRLQRLLPRRDNQPALARLFGYERVDGRWAAALTSDEKIDRLSTWRANLPSAVPPYDYHARALRHAGPRFTSYTELRGEHDRHGDEALPGLRPPARVDDEDLPRGAGVGVFLHELIERTPLEWVADRPTFVDWQGRAARLVETIAKRHGISPRHHRRASQLVHTAWTSPVTLGRHRILGLATAERCRREMEFLYPFPASAQPRLGQPWPPELTLDRGFIKGFIDLVFRHQGLTYFVDWKSDAMTAWDAASLTAHVETNYELQAKIYSLAVAKLLAIAGEREYEERFGGLLYCFLRGMTHDEEGRAGLYFARPSWDALQAWEIELRERRT